MPLSGNRAMTSFVIKLAAGTLPNPDLDLRYEIPDLLKDRSNGKIQSDGYDYGLADPSNLYLFLKTDDPEYAIACITRVMDGETVLENRLAENVVVAMQQGESFTVVYPTNYAGEFKIE